jgi:hypothetical protein
MNPRFDTGLTVTIVSGSEPRHLEETQKDVIVMNFGRKPLLVVAMVGGSMLTGGVVGATLLTPAVSNAATTSTTPASGSGVTAPSPPNGTFKPNEDPTHEAGESAAREAQENAGQVPTVP